MPRKFFAISLSPVDELAIVLNGGCGMDCVHHLQILRGTNGRSEFEDAPVVRQQMKKTTVKKAFDVACLNVIVFTQWLNKKFCQAKLAGERLKVLVFNPLKQREAGRKVAFYLVDEVNDGAGVKVHTATAHLSLYLR